MYYRLEDWIKIIEEQKQMKSNAKSFKTYTIKVFLVLLTIYLLLIASAIKGYSQEYHGYANGYGCDHFAHNFVDVNGVHYSDECELGRINLSENDKSKNVHTQDWITLNDDPRHNNSQNITSQTEWKVQNSKGHEVKYKACSHCNKKWFKRRKLN